MDKRKVVAAYRRGFLTIQECAQILGLEQVQVSGLINDPKLSAEASLLLAKQPISG